MQVQSVLSTKQASVIGAENTGSIPVTCTSWLDARVVDAASLLRKSTFGYRGFESRSNRFRHRLLFSNIFC